MRPQANINLDLDELTLLYKLVVIHEDKLNKNAKYHLDGNMPEAANALIPQVMRARRLKEKMEAFHRGQV